MQVKGNVCVVVRGDLHPHETLVSEASGRRSESEYIIPYRSGEKQ